MDFLLVNCLFALEVEKVVGAVVLVGTVVEGEVVLIVQVDLL